LSLTFPEGERFFVDSVRALRDQVSDPARQKEISGFIGQEAMHSKEHNAFNAYLAEQGYADLAKRGEALARMLLKGARVRLTQREQLGATAALEHITAILAKTILENPRWLKQIDASVRPLWLWHCIEETEHKGVAFDLYKDVGGTDNQRRFLLFAGTLYLAFYTTLYTWRFLKQDGITRKPLTLLKGAWKLFGYKGVLSPGIIEYFRFYAKDFHPWQDNNSETLHYWHNELTTARAAM
ncbi:MAG TPA: metal-dependent hydrolase, partial [Pseudomonadales bacterium]|nr:metal-dependent hydrolase [Pseudomonadales bacterium]